MAGCEHGGPAPPVYSSGWRHQGRPLLCSGSATEPPQHAGEVAVAAAHSCFRCSWRQATAPAVTPQLSQVTSAAVAAARLLEATVVAPLMAKVRVLAPAVVQALVLPGEAMQLPEVRATKLELTSVAGAVHELGPDSVPWR
mmetsp:Transcript_53322/g.115249  ORF Transcript_53322/g.115249 Transcript_53322/m.115249 type:complete len:141 (+) Transcript_53322:227-649(+)